MKKPNRERALRITRLRTKQNHRGRKDKDRSKQKSPQRIVEKFVVRAPEIVGLGRPQTHAALVSFLQKLKVETLIERRHVCIDFRRTTRLYADGTLLMYAEIDSLLKQRQGCLSCKQSATDLVNEVFEHIGFFKLIGVKCAIRPADPRATDWQVVKSATLDLTAAGSVLERLANNEAVASSLFVGLQEAGTNIVQHAYLDERGDGFGSKHVRGWWWAFFKVNREKGTLTLCMCDLGVGIPRTIELALEDNDPDIVWGLSRLASTVFGIFKTDDAILINAAVESKRSRTGMGWRGKGLGQIRNVIDRGQSGSLTIFSNSGAYHVKVDPGQRDQERVVRYSESIYGTMVSWTVPMTSSAEFGDG